MSIERNIERIAQALELIAQKMSIQSEVAVVQQPVVQQPVVQQPIVEQPIVEPVSDFNNTSLPFGNDGEVVEVGEEPSPFENNAQLAKYAMDLFKSIGKERGLKIREVITGMGYPLITDIPKERFTEFKRLVDQL